MIDVKLGKLSRPHKLVYIKITILIIFRYPVAIKKPTSSFMHEVNIFLEEVKSMLEINGYHENIVNLQGITYETVQRLASEIANGMATIEVSLSQQS